MNFNFDFTLRPISSFLHFLSLQPFGSTLARLSPPRDFSLSLDMENTNIQPEDVRAPSADSSPTQVPPEDLQHQAFG